MAAEAQGWTRVSYYRVEDKIKLFSKFALKKIAKQQVRN